MKKLTAALCLSLASISVLGGCGAKNTTTPAANESAATAQNLTANESAAIAQNTLAASVTENQGTFTVGFDAEFPPYGYMDAQGNYVGFDLSLAEEVCNRNGWTLTKQPIDWDAKDMELSSGSIDCIWNGFTINGREDSYTWSTPYVDNSQVFVVSADSGILTHADLAGKVIAVQKDSSALAALNDEENNELKNSFASMIEFSDYNTAFLELQAGSVDAIAMDIGVCLYQMESRGGNFVILDEHLSSEQYGVGFLKGNDTLRDKVQAALDEMSADGTFMRIAEEWGLADSVCLGK